MNFLPEDIENIIVDYKKQFERKYDCSIKHKHEMFETRPKKNITFYKNPYKFECAICKMKICDEHTDEFVRKNTKKDLCANCHLTENQIKKILEDIDDKDKYFKDIRTYKSVLFFFKENDIKEVNNRIKELDQDELTFQDIYNTINKVYNQIQIFDFFEEEI